MIGKSGVQNGGRALVLGGLGLGETLAAEAFDGGTAMTFTLAFVGTVTHLSFGEGVAADDAGGKRISGITLISS